MFRLSSHRWIALLAIVCFSIQYISAAEHPTQTGTPRSYIAADYSKKILVHVGADNSDVWKQTIRDVHDLQILPHGHLLTQTSFQTIVELNDKGEIVWSYDAKSSPGNADRKVEIHAFQRLADGSTMIVESGPARILEVSAEGKVLKEIPLVVKNRDPHRDSRLARKLENGHYLVCHEKDQTVREYDEKGQVVWDYGTGTALYSAERLPNGNTLIGTGNGHSVIEVTPKKEVVWSVTENELPGIKLGWITMVERLPDGNTLIVNCHGGDNQPHALIVTPQRQVVWTLKDHVRFGNNLPVLKLVGQGSGTTR